MILNILEIILKINQVYQTKMISELVSLGAEFHLRIITHSRLPCLDDGLTTRSKTHAMSKFLLLLSPIFGNSSKLVHHS